MLDYRAPNLAVAAFFVRTFYGFSQLKSTCLSAVCSLTVPGMVVGAKIIQTGATHFKLEWLPPLEANGIIVGYTVAFKKGSQFCLR